MCIGRWRRAPQGRRGQPLPGWGTAGRHGCWNGSPVPSEHCTPVFGTPTEPGWWLHAPRRSFPATLRPSCEGRSGEGSGQGAYVPAIRCGSCPRQGMVRATARMRTSSASCLGEQNDRNDDDWEDDHCGGQGEHTLVSVVGSTFCRRRDRTRKPLRTQVPKWGKVGTMPVMHAGLLPSVRRRSSQRAELLRPARCQRLSGMQGPHPVARSVAILNGLAVTMRSVVTARAAATQALA